MGRGVGRAWGGCVKSKSGAVKEGVSRRGHVDAEGMWMQRARRVRAQRCRVRAGRGRTCFGRRNENQVACRLGSRIAGMRTAKS